MTVGNHAHCYNGSNAFVDSEMGPEVSVVLSPQNKDSLNIFGANN